VTEQKYIVPSTFMDWIRSTRKSIQNVSKQWKVPVTSFLIIENHLAWKIGDSE
jgi:hypothetical protein